MTLNKLRSFSNLFGEAIKKFGEHDGGIRAASLAYYALFSIFPMILLLVYIGGEFFAAEETRSALVVYSELAFPESSAYLQNIIDQTVIARGSIGLVGGLGLVWGASSVFGLLELSLSTIWNGNTRAYWKRKLFATLSVIVLGLVFLVSFPLRPLIEWLWLDNELAYKNVISIAVGGGVGTMIIFLLFSIFPNRQIAWRPALIGAVFVSVTIELTRVFITYSLGQVFVKFGYIYGSLAWLITLGVWVYLVAIILFFGAEIGAALERGTNTNRD